MTTLCLFRTGRFSRLVSLALAVGIVVGLIGSSVVRAADRPNVVIVLADDQTWNHSGAYGNPDVHTPNIDKLAEEGMRFTRCFTGTAMCAPTRQQLYTGVFPVRNGAYPNHSRVHDGTRSLVHHFRSLGYRVGLNGKKHFGPAPSFPFENVSKDIGRFMSKDTKQPYFLIVTSHSPHLPWSEGDVSRYDPEKLTLPKYLVDTPDTRVAMTKYYAEITDFDRELGDVMKACEQSGTSDNTIFIYTSEQGAQFPHGKWTCYDTGLRTALVVRWPDKVKPGSVTDAMVQYVDVVPTLLEAAGADPRKYDTGRPGASDGGTGFDGLSFLAVLQGKADEHHTYTYGAHTTRGIINGSQSYPIRTVRSGTHRLIWNPQHDAVFSNVLQTGDKGGYWPSWKELAKSDPVAAQRVNMYIKRPEFELYDVTSDPDELENRADDPALAGVKAELLGKLKGWMKQQGDEGIATELKAKERQGGGNKKKKPKPAA